MYPRSLMTRLLVSILHRADSDRSRDQEGQLKIIISYAAIALVLASTTGHAQVAPDTSYFAAPVRIECPIPGLYEWPNSRQSDSAELTILSPAEGQLFSAGDSVFITVSVAGIAIGAQTAHASSCGLTYHPEGQHTHIVLDDGTTLTNLSTGRPFYVTAATNGTHTLRVFACRSWHESIKSSGSFKMVTYRVGDSSDSTPSPGGSGQPILTYNSPRGEYESDSTKYLLIDFHLENVSLAPEGHHVRLTVDSASTILTRSVPYLLSGLTPGHHSITLDLLDGIGTAVPGPYTSARQTILVK